MGEAITARAESEAEAERPPAPDAAPLATVVVLTWNRGRELVRCLDALFLQTYRPLEIVIVDDASTDDTPSVIREIVAGAPSDIPIVVRRHERNLGIGPGRNTGIEAAGGSVIAFTDDDCVARPDWLEELLRPFASDPRIAVTGGGVDEPPDRSWVQAAAEGINFLGTEPGDVRSVVGCNMAYRASFLARRPFDPEAHYGDDLDRCFEAAADGHRVYYTPAARVTHHHRRSVRAFLRQQLQRGRGSVWVRRKHGRGLWARKNWVVLLLLGTLLAAPFVPAALAPAVAGVPALLFLAQILVLDRLLGKKLGQSLGTLPLTALGYVWEFAGSFSELLRRR